MTLHAGIMVGVFFVIVAWALECIRTRQEDADRRLTELEDWTRKNGEAGE